MKKNPFFFCLQNSNSNSNSKTLTQNLLFNKFIKFSKIISISYYYNDKNYFFEIPIFFEKLSNDIDSKNIKKLNPFLIFLIPDFKDKYIYYLNNENELYYYLDNNFDTTKENFENIYIFKLDNNIEESIYYSNIIEYVNNCENIENIEKGLYNFFTEVVSLDQYDKNIYYNMIDQSFCYYSNDNIDLIVNTIERNINNSIKTLVLYDKNILEITNRLSKNNTLQYCIENIKEKNKISFFQKKLNKLLKIDNLLLFYESKLNILLSNTQEILNNLNGYNQFINYKKDNYSLLDLITIYNKSNKSYCLKNYDISYSRFLNQKHLLIDLVSFSKCLNNKVLQKTFIFKLSFYKTLDIDTIKKKLNEVFISLDSSKFIVRKIKSINIYTLEDLLQSLQFLIIGYEFIDSKNLEFFNIFSIQKDLFIEKYNIYQNLKKSIESKKSKNATKLELKKISTIEKKLEKMINGQNINIFYNKLLLLNNNKLTTKELKYIGKKISKIQLLDIYNDIQYLSYYLDYTEEYIPLITLQKVMKSIYTNINQNYINFFLKYEQLDFSVQKIYKNDFRIDLKEFEFNILKKEIENRINFNIKYKNFDNFFFFELIKKYKEIKNQIIELNNDIISEKIDNKILKCYKKYYKNNIEMKSNESTLLENKSLLNDLKSIYKPIHFAELDNITYFDLDYDNIIIINVQKIDFFKLFFLLKSTKKVNIFNQNKIDLNKKDYFIKYLYKEYNFKIFNKTNQNNKKQKLGILNLDKTIFNDYIIENLNLQNPDDFVSCKFDFEENNTKISK